MARSSATCSPAWRTCPSGAWIDLIATSVASPEKPEGFAPKGLVCGFVRVNRPLENGTKLTLADPRRKIQVETVTDIRPARTARKKLGSR